MQAILNYLNSIHCNYLLWWRGLVNFWLPQASSQVKEVSLHESSRQAMSPKKSILDLIWVWVQQVQGQSSCRSGYLTLHDSTVGREKTCLAIPIQSTSSDWDAILTTSPVSPARSITLTLKVLISSARILAHLKCHAVTTHSSMSAKYTVMNIMTFWNITHELGDVTQGKQLQRCQNFENKD